MNLKFISIITLIVLGFIYSFNSSIQFNQPNLTHNSYDHNILNYEAPIYNISESKDYTIIGVASYCDKKCIQSWTCQITKNYLNDTISQVTHIMGTLTRASGFIAYDKTKNLIITSWRGSANIQNWIQDFQFAFEDYSKCKNCKVHVGFMEDFKSIQKKTHEAIAPLLQKYPTARILASGHSMGAALSVIVGLQLRLKYNKQIQIHNIGCPRVGNPDFAQFVFSKIPRTFRLVHNRDLVAHLPPQSFGYHHSAYEVFYDKDMQNYQICNQSGQDSNCSNKFFPQYNPADHDFYFWDLGKILKC